MVKTVKIVKAGPNQAPAVPKKRVYTPRIKGNVDSVPKDLVKGNAERMGNFKSDLYFRPEKAVIKEDFDYGDKLFEVDNGFKMNGRGQFVLERRFSFDEAMYILSVEDDEDALAEEQEAYEALKQQAIPRVFKEDIEVQQLQVDIDALTKQLENVALEARERDTIIETRRGKQKEKEVKEEERKFKKGKDKLKRLVFSKDSLTDPDEEEEQDDTLDSQIGRRFGTVVSYLYDNLQDMEQVEDEIRKELKASKGMKGMYKANLLANLLQVKNAKLSVVKELHGVGKTVSDMEFKKRKEEKEQSSGIGISDAYLADLVSKVFGEEDVKVGKSSKNSKKKNKKKDKKGKKKKDKKKGKKGKKYKVKKKKSEDDYEKDGYSVRIEKGSKRFDKDDDDFATAQFIGDQLMKGGTKGLKMTKYEKHISMEGKYEIIIRAKLNNPRKDWKFEAVNKKGEKIKGFKDDFADLIPDKKDVRMEFNIEKMRATDKNSEKKYRLALES